MGVTHQVAFSFGRVEHPVVAPDRMERVGDLLLPPEITLTLAPTSAGEPEVVARFAVIDGAPECVAVRFTASPRRAGLRQGDLGEFSVTDWTERAYAMVAHTIAEERNGAILADGSRTAESQLTARGVVERARRKRSPRKVTREFLEGVAATYRQNVGDSPTLAVQAAFGGTYRTAAGYVQRARRAGLLPATTPGRKDA